MPTANFFSALLVLLLGSQTFAALKLPTEKTYANGKFLCQVKDPAVMTRENGFYVTVPVDYADPSKGTTDIYAFTPRGLDPAKKTLFYFNGGPGSAAHWGLFTDIADMDINIVLMDQRGNGCSRPDKFSLFLNPDFYSSESVARDANKVREFLKIQTWTVYGISYGTVPATIHASLFPEHTRALILEGTVNNGNEQLWIAPHRRKLLQKMIETLPQDILKRMDDISTVHGQPNTWFSIMARKDLGSNNGLQIFHDDLLKISDDETYQALIKSIRDMFEPITYTPNLLFSTNEVVYYMVSCKELGLLSPIGGGYDSLVNGKLAPAPDKSNLETCSQLKITTPKDYVSSKYPVKVPVTYFQGTNDGATQVPEAIQHYKTVPQGAKQLLLLVKGGHNPNLSNIMYEEEGQKEMFMHALNGEAIPPALLERVQKAQKLRWTYTSKNF